MLRLADDVLFVEGRIDLHNAAEVFAAGLPMVQQHAVSAPLTVNLAGLEQGNTLALAVLLQWLRQTPKAQGLVFQAVPAKMLKIIQACHLQDNLALQAELQTQL